MMDARSDDMKWLGGYEKRGDNVFASDGSLGKLRVLL
jgi:hypothetical protein